MTLLGTASPDSEPSGEIEVEGDPGLVARALQNLLVNAIAYTREGTEVRACVRREGGWALVEVVDACGGLPGSEPARLFEIGWRGDAARTPGATVGTGLGLPIVAMVAELHGGEARIENHGAGCRAVLRLPIGGRTQGPQEARSR